MPKKVIRVMIVEDHDATAYLIKRAFGEQSVRVDWDLSFARDGEVHSARLPPKSSTKATLASQLRD